MRWKAVRLMGAFAAVAMGAASVLAQDYTVTMSAGLLEARPAGATQLNLTSSASVTSHVNVPLPFEFPYEGKVCTTLEVGAFGWVLPSTATSMAFGNAGSPTQAHGQDVTSGAFPYTSGDADGIIAVLWASYGGINDGSAGQGFVFHWTTGNAPARHFVVSWENGRLGPIQNGRCTVQVHLYEGTGRIVFAYSTAAAAYQFTSYWPYVCGIDSPIDARFTVPLLNSASNSGQPPNDFVFDPRTATYTGTFLYDQVVSDASGIGNSLLADRAVSGCEVELRTSSGARYAATTTGEDGTFSIPTIGGPVPPSVAVVAQNAAVSVSATVGGAPASWVIGGSPFGGGTTVGVRKLGAIADPAADLRAAINVARVCGAVRQWVSSKTSDPLPRLNVVVDPASSSATTYSNAAAFLRVASRGTLNSDVWDDAIVARTYGRHVLASIAGAQATAYDDRFDAVTDEPNAVAEGFGYYLWAVVSETSVAIDGTSASTAVVHDLENPAISVTNGPDVAGCVAGAFFDLVDPANEAGDPVDGTAAGDRLFRAVDAVPGSPRPSNVVQGWSDAGYDPVPLVRVLIANHALADDSLELNDSGDEAAPAGVVGFLPKSLTLNRFNEDWFSVTLPAAAAGLAADATYDQLATGATVAVEIRDAGGSLLASGTLVPATGAVHAQTGAVTAGTYKVRVAHVSGGTVPTYTFQVFVPPSMAAEPLRDWTVGRPYDFAVGAADGIAPYMLTVSSGTMPAGIGLNSGTLRATGTPTTVESFPVTVQLLDSGSPANIVQRSQTVTIHDFLTLALPPFVAFPAGKPVDSILPSTGGTEPFVVTLTSGALPGGLAFDGTSLHVTGTATTPGSTDFSLDGVDVAGSTDDVATRAVVTVALDAASAPADLVAGDNACGWWFDAVQGSTVSFSAKTAKGRARRVLIGAVLAPDRSLVTTGSIKGKSGGLSVSKLVCPLSGRYHVIASSADGDATQLTGTVKVAAPKKGGAKVAAFDPTETVSISVGVLPGGTLKLKFAGDKKLDLTAKVVGLRNPAGDLVTFANFVAAAPFGGSLTATLATGGTWTVILGAQSASGTPGKLSYSYSVAQPKDAVYVAE